jgi:hypothetical protein
MHPGCTSAKKRKNIRKSDEFLIKSLKVEVSKAEIILQIRSRMMTKAI